MTICSGYKFKKMLPAHRKNVRKERKKNFLSFYNVYRYS